jgi:hypothetical protein
MRVFVKPVAARIEHATYHQNNFNTKSTDAILLHAAKQPVSESALQRGNTLHSCQNSQCARKCACDDRHRSENNVQRWAAYKMRALRPTLLRCVAKLAADGKRKPETRLLMR